MDQSITQYLVIHGISTVGAVIIFLIRNEHRITKLETTVQLLKEQHNRFTAPLAGLDHQKREI